MKKTLALNLLQAIQKAAEPNLDIIKLGHTDGLFRFVDIDPNSDFHFGIESRSNDGKYIAQFKPFDEDQNVEARTQEGIDAILIRFEKWTRVVRSYNNSYTVFDDPVLKKHEEYFKSTFELVDEDAAYAPFEIPKQLLLASFIENVESFIDQHKEEFRDKAEPARLISECKELVEELPNLPKKSIISRISTVCAKVAMNGMGLLKKFLTTSSPEFAKKIGQLSAENLITLIKNHSDDITSLLN